MKTMRIATLVASVVALSSCSLMTEVTTQKPYAPSDGIRVALDGVAAENLLLLTDGETGDGVLYGLINNPSDQQVDVHITGDNGINMAFSLPARTSYNLSTDVLKTSDKPILIPGNFTPGLTEGIQVTAGDTSASVKIPILSACLEGYKDAYPGPVHCEPLEMPDKHHDKH